MKWLWYTRGTRFLLDFQDIDGASRGIVGCFRLLLSRRYWRAESDPLREWSSLSNVPLSFRPLASFGAFLVLVVLAVESVMQQTITYPSRRVTTLNDSATFAPRGILMDFSDRETDSFGEFPRHSKSTTHQFIAGGTVTIDLSMQAACYRSFQRQLDFATPTANVSHRELYLD